MSDVSRPGDDWPSVSVVMPVRNEADHLELAVASILAQDYPRPFDVCLAVAPSRDGTEELAARLAAADPRVRVVANPAGVTPAGLNAAIAATDGAVVVRVDGHAELSPGYIHRAVETMRRTGAVNVGGIQDARGETPFERSVAAAMSSWFGTGGSRFHVGGVEGPVDTVYLGVFDRAAGDAVGWFDETLVRNQDYELNIRLRAAGGTIWFDPELRVSYRPRGSLRALARQYYEYGWWKAEVLRRHPESLRLRQAIPALAPVALGAGVVGGVVRRRWWAVPGAYLAAVGAAAVSTPVHGGRRMDLAAIFPTMQLSWGVGFIRGALAGRPQAQAAAAASSRHDDQARWDAYGLAARKRIRRRPDRYRVTGWPNAHGRALQRILEGIDLNGQRVLDLGAGLGELTVWLAQRGAAAEGIDLGPNLVAAAQDVAALNGVDARFHVGSITELPFEDGSFDLVVGMSILHHLSEQDVARAAAEAYRVLTPGGRLIVFEPIEDSPTFDLVQNLVPRNRPGQPHHRPSILQRRAWRDWVAAQDDRTMRTREFRAIGERFAHTSLTYSGLTVRLAPLLRRPHLGDRLLEWDDRVLRACPPLRRFARNVVAVYTK